MAPCAPEDAMQEAAQRAVGLKMRRNSEPKTEEDKAKGLPVKEDDSKATIDAHDQESWRKDAPTKFSWSDEKEPHVLRRRAIIEKYPQIKELYKPDPYSAIFCIGTLIVQFGLAYTLRNADWWKIVILAYIVGGTMSHSLVLACHELTHDLWFSNKWGNYFMGMFANVPIIVPFFCSFKRYHLEHHTYQGSDHLDADIPTEFEGKLFRYRLTKMFWVSFQWAFYALRPAIVKPKPATKNELLNCFIVLGINALMVHFWGYKAIAYFALSVAFGLGPHPMSGHFIAEHFEFVKGQETYSYYGPLNFFAYNVGYHNEHHDFPKVPGRMLPKIREICKDSPEFYEDLPHYDSWTKVLTGFIWHENMNCFCRVKRGPLAPNATKLA